MFDHLMSRYLIIPDEAYSVALPFEEAVHFIKFVAKENEYSITNDVLVIEISEGVFIRAQNSEWCIILIKWAEAETPDVLIKIIGTKEWEGLTRKHRSPINSFGDEKLARWKVGF